MRRVAGWRRPVGLLLLVCLGLSSAEVVWADEPIDLPPASQVAGLAPASLVQGDTPADREPASDCACLCACACANAQQVTPAVVLLHGLPQRVHPHRASSRPQRPPRASLPKPHVRPPIA